MDVSYAIHNCLFTRKWKRIWSVAKKKVEFLAHEDESNPRPTSFMAVRLFSKLFSSVQHFGASKALLLI